MPVVGRETIKVLVVDDSALVRRTLTEIIDADPAMIVTATASDPYAAAQCIARGKPDVITLDVEMPRMDGLTFLDKLMRQHPIPVVMCSSLTEQGCDLAIKALELGAVDVLNKARLGIKSALEESADHIRHVVKAAAGARVNRMRRVVPEPGLAADAVIPHSGPPSRIPAPEGIVAIGASTGGTEALRTILSALPPDCPGIVVVQHMPERFTAAFARRLDQDCAVSVSEAVDGDRPTSGRVLIAPGNRHVILGVEGTAYTLSVVDGPPVNRHKPSVDVLFRSVAQCAGAKGLGIILTGMGADGAQGLLEMRQAGARTIAQDEDSCVVFGMPKEAVARGGVDSVVPLRGIAREIMIYRHRGVFGG